MNSIPDLVELLERHLHEARSELKVCQYVVLSYIGDELRVAANEAEQERQELTARIAELEAENAKLKDELNYITWYYSRDNVARWPWPRTSEDDE